MIRVILTVLLLFCGAATAQTNRFLATSGDAIEAAIEAERPAFLPPAGVTGITVPHHLLAADLIARGFWAASGGDYDRIIILAPDHFRRVTGAFATTSRLMQSLGAPVETDPGTNALIEAGLFADLAEIEQDHSIGALLPFVQHFFEDVPVLPVLASIQSTHDDWAAAIDLLAPLITDQTLVIQSTDFSHFLAVGRAVLHDQEVLNVTATGDPDGILALAQPDHMDSRAAHYMMMSLQRQLGSTHAVLANRNSTDYGGNPDEVTSYLTMAWHRNPQALSRLTYPDQNRVWVGGDVLLGRALGPILAHGDALGAVLETVHGITRGEPLVINLEGALAEGPVANLPPTAHIMDASLALPTLRGLGVVAAGLANNHSWDFGAGVAEETTQMLEGAGITALRPKVVVDLGALRIVAANMLPGRDPYQTPDSLRALFCQSSAPPPLVAFLHWGAEYTDAAGSQETQIADLISGCGVALILGSHSHRASSAVALSDNGQPFVFSLGNFLFDQSSPRASGALAELRVFEQGTMAVRLVPIPNLFERGLQVLSE